MVLKCDGDVHFFSGFQVINKIIKPNLLITLVAKEVIHTLNRCRNIHSQQKPYLNALMAA